MNIELSSGEIDLIDKALKAWETEQSANSFTGALLGMIMVPAAERTTAKLEANAMMEKAAQEGDRRRRVATLLRAKLYVAQAKASEHEVTAEPEAGPAA